jgi:hypothetical protein
MGRRIVRQCFWLNADYVRVSLGLGPKKQQEKT